MQTPNRLFMLYTTVIIAACSGDKVATSDITLADAIAEADVRPPDDVLKTEDITELEDEGGNVEDVPSDQDANVATDAEDVGADTSIDIFGGFTCECGRDEVFRWGSCVPTLMLGCGPSCDETAPCGTGLECNTCAASTTCGSRDCQAACVVPVAPHALVPELLRISPTTVPSDGGTVTISGTSFYIGALGHRVRIGDLSLGYTGGGDCELPVVIPRALADGAHVIEVSQYSGDGPWVVAGIIFKGTATAACIQPGMPCETGSTCCSTATLPTACEAGRCRLTATSSE